MIIRKNRKRVDLERRRRRQRILWVWMGIAVVGYFAFLLVFSERGLIKFLEVAKTQRHLTQEVQRVKEHNEELRQRAQALRSDDDTIEEIARRELGLVKKGELIYQFQRESEE